MQAVVLVLEQVVVKVVVMGAVEEVVVEVFALVAVAAVAQQENHSPLELAVLLLGLRESG